MAPRPVTEFVVEIASPPRSGYPALDRSLVEAESHLEAVEEVFARLAPARRAACAALRAWEADAPPEERTLLTWDRPAAGAAPDAGSVTAAG